MTDDATLDAFGDTDETASVSDNADETPTDSGEFAAATAEHREGVTSDAESEADVSEPLPTTSSWRPDGDCSACGERASRRWWEDDELVCTDCVSWRTDGDP